MKRNKVPKQGSSPTVQTSPIEVYCRVRPLPNAEDSCLKVIPPNQIRMTPSLSNIRSGGPTKAMQYTFKRVFEESATQKCVFTNVALPLIQNVLAGKNGLLFTYGVTGSGKTYTMTGSGQDGGILPRCLDTIFNSIADYQAKKHIFKPDRLNGFDIQSEEEALADKEQDLLAQIISTKGNRNKFDKKNSDPDLVGRVRDTTKLDNIDEDNVYAVFITYVEIYNNTVYDLLDDVFEDGHRARPLQAKIVREDAFRNMYVHSANELEVYSTDEAFEIFYRAQKRKRVAQTQLNTESSRSHSIFTIRVVQAPVDADGEKVVSDKKAMVISQLSLVDLAGSERTNRTKNTGQRLKEAGNINNSLLTLRTCLELLRENQNGANKIIPYRESRLTHLFKNYFDGEGQVTMIVCVSQHIDDYDENLHVMKFAEMSQEVQISCPSAVKTTTFLTPGRRRANLAFKEAVNSEGLENNPLSIGAGDTGGSNKNIVNGVPKGLGLFGELFTEIPDLRFIDPEDDSDHIPRFCNYMEENLLKFNQLASEFQKKRFDFRDVLMQSERQAFLASQEVQSWKSLYEKEKEKISAVEAKATSADSQAAKMKRKLDEYEVTIKKLRHELSDKETLLSQNKVEKDKVKEHYSNKLTHAQEKLNKEMERKLRSQKSALEYEMRNKDEKLRAVRRLLSDENGQTFDNVPGNRARLALDSRSVESLMSSVETPRSGSNGAASSVLNTPLAPPPAVTCRSTCRRMGVPVANRRHRRSRSAGDVWLEHKPKTPVPLNTLMQPTMTKRKSVSKLTDAKDVTEKTNKYCLMTQGQDSDGDLETRLYKGDVIPTAGGGAQVMFNDVEVLKQVSPTVSPSRKRPDEIRRDIEAACAVAMEGHKMRRKQ